MSDKTDATFRDVMEAYVGISPDPPPLPDVRAPRPRRRPALVFAAAFTAVVFIGAATVALVGPQDRDTAGDFPTTLPAEPTWTHLGFTHTQTIDLKCESMQIFDQGGFDDITFDVWRDADALLTRVRATYPDGSTYDLVFEGPAGSWQRAWARGTDHGRQAGCVEYDEDGSSGWVYAGEAWLDFGSGPAKRFLVPLQVEEDHVGVYVFVEDHEPNLAFESFERDAELRWFRYSYDSRTTTTTTLASWYPGGPPGEESDRPEDFVALRTLWYGLDSLTSELRRVEREYTSPLFAVSTTDAVTTSDTGPLDTNVFDLSGYQPVWDTETPVVTTAPPPP